MTHNTQIYDIRRVVCKRYLLWYTVV